MAKLIVLGNAASRRTMERIKAMLSDGAYSVAQVCTKLEISRHCANQHIRTLKAWNEVYVDHWAKTAATGNVPIAYYRIGNEPDAARPSRVPKPVGKRKCVKAEEDPMEAAIAEAKAQIKSLEQSRKAQGLPVVPPDPLLAWIPRRDLREAA